MKKEIRNLILLTITLSIISIIVITIFGQTYTLEYRLPREKNFNVIIEQNKDIIEIIKQEKKNNKYYIKIKAKKPGKAFITLNFGEISESKNIYVHKNKVITENSYLGKSTFSEIIPISNIIILIYLIYIIYKEYRKSIKENLYQYKNIVYIGIIIFLIYFLLNVISGMNNYIGIEDTIRKAKESIGTISITLFPIALPTFILATISNILLIKKEGKSIKNLLGVFLGIIFCILPLMPDIAYKILMKIQIVDIYNLNSIGPYLYDFIESMIYISISYLECLIIGTIIIAIKSVKRKVELNKEYIIILGCKVNKDGTLTPLLRGRVDRALSFRNEQIENNNQDLTFICSGGQGTDETISEGEAMKNYLLTKGINKKNIIVENKSKNTYENIKNSYQLIKKKDAKIAFSTTNYHVLRAGLIATEQGVKIEGIGSKTKAYFWINAFIREYIGTLYNEKKKHIIIFIIIIIYIILLLIFLYISNNM